MGDKSIGAEAPPTKARRASAPCCCCGRGFSPDAFLPAAPNPHPAHRQCSKPLPPFAGVPKSGKPARRAHEG
ncbi:DUF6053 domain-containing protein [Lysobacter enzymogenes]|uniref:DUF6053 domain-containing protein n=1 Tax=Lysobacter enzymogenes TaxID=69 RepID=UPI003D1878E0